MCPVVVRSGKSSPSRCSWLGAFLGTPRASRDGDDARTVYELMRAHGSIAFARDGARQLAREAVRTFPEAFDHLPEGRDKRFLREIARYRMERRV